MAWFSPPPGSLFYAHLKKNGTNILHTKTRLQLDKRPLYLPTPHPPTYPEWPITWCLPSPLVQPAPVRTSVSGIKYLASSHTSHSTPSLWRWNWYRVPKRRPTTIWRRGNTQKKIYNIQITAKVWNQEYIKRTFNVYMQCKWNIKNCLPNTEGVTFWPLNVFVSKKVITKFNTVESVLCGSRYDVLGWDQGRI